MIIRMGFIKQNPSECDLNSQSKITHIDEYKWDFMYMLKSHKLNCELNYFIENSCCDMINDL